MTSNFFFNQDHGDEAQKLIKMHQQEAEDSFRHFRENLVKELDRDLSMMDQEMNK